MKPVAVPVASAVCLIATGATGAVAPLWSLLVAAVSLAVIASVYFAVKRQFRRELQALR
jgi:hypothetical protein